MFNILQFPDPFLRQKLPEFDFLNPIHNPAELEKQMLDIMYANSGIGLSASQLGINARVFVMGHRDSPELGKAFFNPMVLKHTDEVDHLNEGCLSFPGMIVKVKRPKKILARWQNTLGEWTEGEFAGYDCKCFLHELDHLEGIVFKDRISTIRWVQSLKEKNKGKKYHGRAK